MYICLHVPHNKTNKKNCQENYYQLSTINYCDTGLCSIVYLKKIFENNYVFTSTFIHEGFKVHWLCFAAFLYAEAFNCQ